MHNYHPRPHMITARDYEGYGVYASVGQLPQIPGFTLPTELPSMPDKMISVGGIQVVRTEFQQVGITLLDQTTLQLDPGVTAQDPMQMGQASVVFGQLGSGWASDYISRGYAVLVQIATAESGSPLVMLTNAPKYIVDFASDGDGYVLVAGPDALLQAAVQMKQNGNGVVQNGNGVVIEPPVKNGKVATGAPVWMWPAIIGVGAVVLVGGVMAATRK